MLYLLSIAESRAPACTIEECIYSSFFFSFSFFARDLLIIGCSTGASLVLRSCFTGVSLPADSVGISALFASLVLRSCFTGASLVLRSCKVMVSLI